MKESNFLKEFRIATAFLQSFQDFQAKLECLKKVHPEQFSKRHFVIHLHPSQPFFLMGSYHFLGVVFQNKTIIVGFSNIWVCF